MKTVLSKLAEARQIIKQSKLKKSGYNDFSKYDYFTPEQVQELVNNASTQTGLITLFNLKRNELGISGYLDVIELETQEKITFEMATDIPQIKATNIAQQLGGCVTYTERYLKMVAFGIVENEADLDNKTLKEKPATKRSELQPKTEAWQKCVQALKDGFTIQQIKSKYDISDENQELLISEAL